MRVLVSRSRLDTDDRRPSDRTFDFGPTSTLTDAVKAIASSDYVNADGTWRVFSHVPVAVMSRKNGSLETLAFLASRPEEYLFKDGVYRLSFSWTRNEDMANALTELERLTRWLPASILRQLEAGGFVDAYYDLCRRHLLRSADEPLERMPGREIVRRSKGIVDLKTERGPGTVLVVTDMPAELRLSFVIMSRTTVSAALRGALLTGLQNGELGMFRIFCREAKEQVWDNNPDRLYQDPHVYSIDEMLAVLLQLKSLSLAIAQALSGQDLSQFKPDPRNLDASVRKWIPTQH